MAFAYCLDCGGRIYLGHRPWVGQEAYCEWCDAELEVTRVNPLELDWIESLAQTPDEEEVLESDSLLVPA